MRILPTLLTCLMLLGYQSALADEAKPYPDPEKFEKHIEKFEKADVEKMPPEGAVLVVGSSSIRKWHGEIAKDLEPLTIVGRGFGGSNTNDLLHYADRIVFKYKPRAIVIYEGDNDVAQGVGHDTIIATYTLLLDAIKKNLPDCRVYVLVVKPSPRRWDMWPTMRRVNASLSALASDRSAVTYIDIASPMLGKDGKPKAELYVKDRLHMSRAGYDVWRDAIRPMLVEAEREHEPED